jgi:hypothetical protein
MDQIDTGYHFEQFTGQMARSSYTCRGEIDLARIGLRVGDKLWNSFSWK